MILFEVLVSQSVRILINVLKTADNTWTQHAAKTRVLPFNFSEAKLSVELFTEPLEMIPRMIIWWFLQLQHSAPITQPETPEPADHDWKYSSTPQCVVLIAFTVFQCGYSVNSHSSNLTCEG